MISSVIGPGHGFYSGREVLIRSSTLILFFYINQKNMFWLKKKLIGWNQIFYWVLPGQPTRLTWFFTFFIFFKPDSVLASDQPDLLSIRHTRPGMYRRTKTDYFFFNYLIHHMCQCHTYNRQINSSKYTISFANIRELKTERAAKSIDYGPIPVH